MNTQAKVAVDKQKHPELYCREPRCLFKIAKLDHVTKIYYTRPDCPGGRCPRHQRKAQSTELTLDQKIEAFRKRTSNETVFGPHGECPHCGQVDCRCDKEHYL